MSVYDLKKHPLYVFRPGSVVKRKPIEENKLGHVLDSYPQVSSKMSLRLNSSTPAFIYINVFLQYYPSSFIIKKYSHLYHIFIDISPDADS